MNRLALFGYVMVALVLTGCFRIRPENDTGFVPDSPVYLSEAARPLVGKEETDVVVKAEETVRNEPLETQFIRSVEDAVLPRHLDRERRKSWRRVLYGSTAAAFAVVAAVIGLACGILYSVGGFFVDLFTRGLNWGTLLAFGAIIGMPVVFAAFGFGIGLAFGVVARLLRSARKPGTA